MYVCILQASKDLLREHYADLKTKKFFNGLVDFMASGPVVCMVGRCVGNHVCFPNLATTTVSCNVCSFHLLNINFYVISPAH